MRLNDQRWLEMTGAFLLYLAMTLLCLRLAWFIPGRGIESILIRLLSAGWLPAIAVVAVSPSLQKRGRTWTITGMIAGMCCIALVLLAGAMVMASKFRL